MKILQNQLWWVAMMLALALIFASGCYSNREVMLRNPKHLVDVDLDDDQLAASRLLDSTSGLYGLPPGHEEQMLPLRPTPIWRLGDSHPDKIKTIFFDSTKQVSPNGYSWDNGSLVIMESRNYQFGTYRVDLSRVDSMSVVFSDTENKEGITRLFSVLGFAAFTILMCTTVD